MRSRALIPMWSGGFLCLPPFPLGILSLTIFSLGLAGPRADEQEEALENDLPLDDDYIYETEVRSVRILPTDETTGFAQTLKVEQEAKTFSTVTEVLSEAVGVQVKRLGGLGSFGAASIRGSTPGQVPIFLDGVMLNTGGFSSVNLGGFSLDTLESIEVYRGGAPVRLGTSGIGGAISLKTKAFKEPVTEVATSYGSWNTGRLMALHGNQIGEVKGLVIVTLEGSEGDFQYFNYNGTWYNEEDDRIERRENNWHVAYGSLIKLDGELGSWGWTAVNDFHGKRQGISGIDNNPTENVELRTLRNMASLNIRKSIFSKADLELGLSYLALREDFDDTDNEIGVGYQRTIARSDTVGGHALVEIEPAPSHSTDGRIDVDYDYFAEEELVRGEAAEPSKRVRIGLGLEHEWRPCETLHLVPALRLAFHSARFGGGPIPGTVSRIGQRSSDSFFWSPSFGARWEAVSGLTLRINAGRYVRPPDLIELFGDRGAIVGNPELDPEIGINADAGFTYILENRGPLSLMRVDAAWFGSWVSQLIAYVKNSQHTIRPENVDAARILGAETSLGLLMFDLVSFRANYTYLHGINQSSKPYHRNNGLPGRPEHEVYGNVEIGRIWHRWGAAAWFDVDYAGHNYLNQYNSAEDALARLFFGLGGRISRPAEGLTLTVEMRNLLNTITVRDKDGKPHPLRDYEGFALPGRTIFVTLHWNT